MSAEKFPHFHPAHPTPIGGPLGFNQLVELCARPPHVRPGKVEMIITCHKWLGPHNDHIDWLCDSELSLGVVIKARVDWLEMLL